MANQDLPVRVGWTQVRRHESSPIARPTIRFRSNGGIALSARFVRAGAIEAATHVNVYISEDRARLGFRFHTDASQTDAFVVSADGGGRQRRFEQKLQGRILQAPALVRSSPFIKRLVSMPAKDRTFEPQFDSGTGLWVVALRPCFECRYMGLSGELSRSDTGIYRYLLDGQAVYIGRGVLTARFASADRNAWEFDRIEYSLLNDNDAEIRWEAYWLDRFREDNDRLPIYNRIGGRRDDDERAVDTASETTVG